MSGLPVCKNIDEYGSSKSKKRKEYNPDQLDDLDKRIDRLHNIHERSASMATDAAAARKQVEAMTQTRTLEKWVRHVGKATTLSPKQEDRFGRFMYTQLAQKHLLPGKFSTSGDVGYKLHQASRVGQGIVEQIVRFEGARKTRQIAKQIRHLAKDKGIGKEMADELIDKAIEVGLIPMRRAMYGVGTPADIFNMNRYSKFVEQLASLGFSEAETKLLLDGAAQIGNVMLESRAVAKSFGLDLGYEDAIGYFRRQITPDAERFIKANQEAKTLFGEIKAPHNPLDLNSVFNISRKTDYYVPQDDVVAAHFLGLEIDKLQDLISNPKDFVKWLHDPKNIKWEDVEKAIDLGVFAKIPMLTDEVFEYMVDQFDLPFRHLKEVFLTDPERVVDSYQAGLREAVGNSAMTKYIMGEGVKAGWAIPDDVFRVNPNAYQGFKKLDAERIRQFLPDTPDSVTAVHVHPIVSDVWESILTVSTDPKTSSYIASVLNQARSFLTQSLLATPQYAFRSLVQNFLQIGAAGGNYMRFHEGLYDVARARYFGEDAFDNTKKVYQIGGKKYTKREMFREFTLQRPKDVIPFTEGIKLRRDSKSFSAWNPANFARGAGYLANYTKTYGLGGGASYGVEMLRRLNSDAFEPLAAFAAYSETAAKFATALSLADIRPSSKLGSFVSSLGQLPRSFENWDQLYQHIDEYFYPFDEVGKVTQQLSLVKPFLSWGLNNFTGVIRHIIRNPRPFVNYMRLRSIANSGLATDEEMIESAYPDYMLESGTVGMFKDQGKWVVLLPDSYDGVSDFVSRVGKMGKTANRFYGFYTGSANEQYRQVVNGSHSQLMQDLTKELHPIWTNLVSLVSQTDIETGRKINELETSERKNFLGFKVSPMAHYILSSYPPLDAVDRWNPGEAWGRPDIRNPRNPNEVIRPGHLSVQGNSRGLRQIDKYDPISQKYGLNFLRFMGFTVKIVDPAVTVKMSLKERTSLAAKTKSELTNGKRRIFELKEKGEHEEAARINEEYLELAGKYGQMIADIRRTENYMAKYKITPDRIWKEMDSAKYRAAKESGALDDGVLEFAVEEYMKAAQPYIQERENGK